MNMQLATLLMIMSRIATVTTTTAHGLAGGDVVMLKDILLECEDGSKIYPTDYDVKIPSI